jgi:hypothetical protein
MWLKGIRNPQAISFLSMRVRIQTRGFQCANISQHASHDIMQLAQRLQILFRVEME